MDIYHKGRTLLEDDPIICIPSGIDAFPADFFTKEQREHGGVVVHFIILFYICGMTAVVCDEYFVPALESIVKRFQLSPDVAGATFMAMGASAPELFSSIAGSFITEGDIGIGTILGSAVFNILGITGVVGIVLWNTVLTIQWFPVVRDCIVYTITISTLSFIIVDNIVKWWEALILLTIFSSYIILMHFNVKVERAAQSVVKSVHNCCINSQEDPENGPLLGGQGDLKEKAISSDEDDAVECNFTLWKIFKWAPSLLFWLTIPPIRFYPLTFLMSIIWMGVLSYIAVWMVTIIAYTLHIPDSAAGLTLLAAGSSVPDLVATVIIARSGKGNMAISNLLGSNIFDLAFCLGAPWFVKSLISAKGQLLVYSSTMVYTTVTLLVSLLALLLTFHFMGWVFNRRTGIICLFLYATSITLSCLYELNVFGYINKPTCF